MKKILVFASGSKTGGGSGFGELVEHTKTGLLPADIVAVVSSHPEGGVFQIAQEYGVPFEYFPGPYEAEGYQKLVAKYSPDLIALSGWLKLAKGLDPTKTINIHPGPLPLFGGQGMYGHFVHESVIDSYKKGLIMESAVTMHFVTDEYDKGPVIFRYPVLIREDDTAETLAARVNEKERAWQWYITKLVLTGEISWDGQNPKSLLVPQGYPFL
ncbi:hypothetical protein HYV44_02455 [Candidatus Microgenomates bacterium]|nr:hypothetical protein [Candidatus Microgenomates bacterium]